MQSDALDPAIYCGYHITASIDGAHPCMLLALVAVKEGEGEGCIGMDRKL